MYPTRHNQSFERLQDSIAQSKFHYFGISKFDDFWILKSKFYDFNDQIIDGEIKKPTTLYTDSRERVKFDRLLKLKKSFMPQLFDTAKERVFK